MIFPGAVLSDVFTLRWTLCCRWFWSCVVRSRYKTQKPSRCTWSGSRPSFPLGRRRLASLNVICRSWCCHIFHQMIMFLLLNLHVCVVLLQPCFAEVEFPESNFADQIELLLKDPEEKEKYFQVWICCIQLFTNRMDSCIYWSNLKFYRIYNRGWRFTKLWLFLPGGFSYGLWAWLWQCSSGANAGLPLQAGEASTCTWHSTGNET